MSELRSVLEIFRGLLRRFKELYGRSMGFQAFLSRPSGVSGDLRGLKCVTEVSRGFRGVPYNFVGFP